MQPKRARSFQSVGEVIGRVLEGRGLGRGNVLARLQARWAEAVGEGVARHAWPEMLKGGRLTLVVDSPAWMNQLSLLSPAIIGQVNAKAGEGTVTELRFKAGAAANRRAANGKEPPFVPKRRRPTKEELEEMERSLSDISDESVKASARRMLTAACERKREL